MNCITGCFSALPGRFVWTDDLKYHRFLPPIMYQGWDFMNNQINNAAVYIIDSEFRILYFNQVLKKCYPELRIGELCFASICAESHPCPGCPLVSGRTEGTIFYNKCLRKWVEVNTARFDTVDDKDCKIILAREIKEDNRNLFYNLTNLSTYDELFELNLTNDSYKILYHMDGKYVIPAPEGRLEAMIQEVVAGMIYPDDRDAFLAFWNLDNILPRLAQDGRDNILRGQFRKKKMDGTWCWVQQTVVPLCQGDKDDQILMCFIQDINEEKLREPENEDAAQAPLILDPLTGLYNKTDFFRVADSALRRGDGVSWCLMAIDIEHFKLFNEWYGIEAGDTFLKEIAAELKKAQSDGVIAGYLGEDDFGVLVPNRPGLLEKLQNQVTRCVLQYGDNAGFLPAFGLYAVKQSPLPVSTMYDRASLAMSKIKGNYARRVCWYDDSMFLKMENDHMLLTQVQKGLERHEFTFYAQPKCNIATGKIVGLESLVRWNHPQHGVVLPGAFIPTLEEYGFIAKLDLYIWEEVCVNLRRWIDSGHRPIPISVNVSQVDVYTMDVAESLQNLVERYDLKPELLEIEITESAYAEEFQIITNVVDKLRSLGFTVLMDDFGSGYSSLNMLKDVHVDVLKIDMKFLEMDEQSADKGISILESLISMARLIGLRIIAEGIETAEQLDFLLNMGCMYGQGYYFYKPMPIEIFEPLLAKEDNLDFRGVMPQKLQRLSLKELLNEDLMTESIINNILGGIAFYDVYEDQVQLLRANEQYRRITGDDLLEPAPGHKTRLDNVYPEDRAKTMDIFLQARKNIPNGALGEVRYLREDGNTIWLQLRIFFLREQDGHSLYYGAVSDITVQKQREQLLINSQRALSAVVHISENDSSFMKLTEENRRAAASIFAQMSPGGMIGGYCEDGFPLYFANNAIVSLMGFDSYEELEQAIQGKVINTIHPDDREAVARDIGPEYYPGLEYTTTYRMPKKDGSWFWTLDKGQVIRAEDGRLAIVSACTDISETMAAQRQLAERNALLLRQNQELNFLYNDMPGGYHRCAKTKDYDFIYISNRFLEIFGYTREEIKELFDDKFLNMVHPDDRPLVNDGVNSLQENRGNENLEYRMLSKHGYIWVVDQSRYMEYRGNPFLQGVVMDITETVMLREKMKRLEKGAS